MKSSTTQKYMELVPVLDRLASYIRRGIFATMALIPDHPEPVGESRMWFCIQWFRLPPVFHDGRYFDIMCKSVLNNDTGARRLRFYVVDGNKVRVRAYVACDYKPGQAIVPVVVAPRYRHEHQRHGLSRLVQAFDIDTDSIAIA